MALSKIDCIGIVEEEAEQYRYDMLAEIANLPSQDEVELTEDMLSSNFWEEIQKVGFHGFSELRHEDIYPTLRDYLKYLSDPEGIYYYGVPFMETYHYICLRYGFRPNIPRGLRRFIDYRDRFDNQGLDISHINERVNTQFMKEIDFLEIGMQKATIDKFQQAGIITVGDFILNAATARMHKQFKMSPTTLQKVADYIDEKYDINRRDFKKFPILRESLRIRYAVLKGTQSMTE